MNEKTSPHDQALDALLRGHQKAGGEELERLRALTLEERGQMIVSACRSAATILHSRRRAGLPDPEPEPWPESTMRPLRGGRVVV